MKKLLTATATLLILIAATFLLLRPSTPAPEPPELAQARAAAQVAALAREGQDASFRSSFFQWTAVIFLCLIVGIIIAALVYLFGVKAHQQRMELARISKDYDIIYPDGGGSYPVTRLPDGSFQWFEPGNITTTPQFVHGLQPAPLTTRTRPGRDLTVRANQQPIAAYYSHFVEADRLESPEILREIAGTFEAGNSEISDDFQDLLPLMRDMIERGRGKTDTLKALGLGGRKYARAAKLYDELKGQVK
ncbi:MAG: hypothetical protein H0X33_13360 [Taibaiella sp.]|nr:hypothetical protein [Taibaiella sp.]